MMDISYNYSLEAVTDLNIDRFIGLYQNNFEHPKLSADLVVKQLRNAYETEVLLYFSVITQRNGEVAAAIAVYSRDFGNTVYDLFHICVHKDHRRQGLATEVILSTMKFLIAAGAKELHTAGNRVEPASWINKYYYAIGFRSVPWTAKDTDWFTHKSKLVINDESILHIINM